MIFYLTINEFYSGIYQGQVIDVVTFLNEKFNKNIRLLAFLPLTNFWKRRKEIKAKMPNAIVLPMLPKQSIGTRWEQSRFILYIICRIYNCKAIIARNPLATCLAIAAKEKGCVSKVCFDGRGAVAAEAEEYNIYPLEIKNRIRMIERAAILNSDFQIAITQNLLKYWRTEYSYNAITHTIIPGTLNRNFINLEINFSVREESRKRMGYTENDILLIYAGSTEGWQSFQLLYDFLKNIFAVNSSVKVLFLSQEEQNINKLSVEFPQKIRRLWLMPSEVKDSMLMGDYGLIIRENSITNNVAMPTKFPEYLACGLSVISNRGASEVAKFIENNDCGIVIDDKLNIFLEKSTLISANQNRMLALKCFNKKAPEIMTKYSFLLNELTKN